jgi:hypothetical protein
MTSTTLTPSVVGWRNRPSGRFLLTVALVVAVAAAVFGGRVALQGSARHAVPTFGSGPAVPTSAVIEQRWGIKVTGVILLADGGLVAIRYQVVDPAKDGKIHSGGTANLPVLIDERTGREIRSTAALMHVHYADGGTTGKSYSILYGNSGGALSRGAVVTIKMADGSSLRHVTVVN